MVVGVQAETQQDLPALLAQVSPPASETMLAFKEARSYPFRKYPKDFSGTIQWTPDGTVSVTYTFPSEYTLVLDARGVRLVQDDGSERDLGDPAGLALLRNLVRWDTAAIAEQWALDSLQRVDGQMQLLLEPTSDAMAKRVKRLSVTCSTEGVTAVRVDQTDGIRRDYRFVRQESPSSDR